MWIRYSEIQPKQAWMVIYLLRDALFALDRYDELEHILRDIIDKDKNNSEVIATLADMVQNIFNIQYLLNFTGILHIYILVSMTMT